MPCPEVGAVHSSNDDRDNITLSERRGCPFAALVREYDS